MASNLSASRARSTRWNVASDAGGPRPDRRHRPGPGDHRHARQRQHPHQGVAPASLATFHRVLRALDAERFDAIVYAWTRLRFTTDPGGRRVIAADGKTIRGAKDSGCLLYTSDAADDL